MKAKQHTPEHSVGQGRNWKENQKISWAKQKWKHHILRLTDYSKEIRGEKLIVINAYFKKKIKLPSKNPTLQLRKPNVGRRNEIMKIRAEINQIENLKK